MKVHTQSFGSEGRRVEWWYDPSCRSWAAITVDRDGNQLGDADYVGTKSGVLACVFRRVRGDILDNGTRIVV